MKYNRSNVGNTLAKMRKLHPELVEYKDEISKKRYFYDFSLLENIPEEVRENIKTEIMRKAASYFTDCFSVPYSGDYKYYIDGDIQRYIVYNKSGKPLYRIMEVSGVQVTAYKWNIYGCLYDNAMPESCEVYGKIRKTTLSNIYDIEVK